MFIIKGKENQNEMKYCFISLACCVQYLVSYKSSWNLEKEYPRDKIQAIYPGRQCSMMSKEARDR